MTTSIPTQPPHAPTDWSLVILLGVLTAFGALCIDMYLPALPAIEHSFGARTGAAQTSLATFFAGLSLGQFVYGPASDRWGRRGPLLVGVVIYLFASVVCALAPSLVVLSVGRLFQGLGACCGAVIGRAIARDRFDHQGAARVLSQLMLVMGLAPILAPLAGSGLLLIGSWRVILWVFVAFGGVVGVWMFASLVESRSAETEAKARSEHPLRTYLSLLKMPSLIGYTLAGAFNSAALFGYIAASPGLLIQTYHISPTLFGVVFGINGAGLIAASQLNAHLLRFHSPEYILIRSRPATLAFAVILALDAYAGLFGLWGVLVPLFGVIGSFGLVGANTQAAGLNADPHRAGSISALMGGAGFAAGALVSSLTAAFADGTARPMAATILGAILASTLALYGLARPAARRV